MGYGIVGAFLKPPAREWAQALTSHLSIAQYFVGRGTNSVMGIGRAIEQIEEQIILTIDIPDDVLEGAAETANDGSVKNFTVAACTGLAACPS
jgi:hypothetical protein